MKNSADQGGCYPQRPKAEADNTLRDLQNFSYPTKAEFSNCGSWPPGTNPYYNPTMADETGHNVFA